MLRSLQQMWRHKGFREYSRTQPPCPPRLLQERESGKVSIQTCLIHMSYEVLCCAIDKFCSEEALWKEVMMTEWVVSQIIKMDAQSHSTVIFFSNTIRLPRQFLQQNRYGTFFWVTLHTVWHCSKVHAIMPFMFLHHIVINITQKYQIQYLKSHNEL